MFENVMDGKLEHEGKVFDVKMLMGSGTFFVFESSLPKGLVPKVGDKILWNFEIDHFDIIEVVPLTSSDYAWSNYVLTVALPD